MQSKILYREPQEYSSLPLDPNANEHIAAAYWDILWIRKGFTWFKLYVFGKLWWNVIKNIVLE